MNCKYTSIRKFQIFAFSVLGLFSMIKDAQAQETQPVPDYDCIEPKEIVEFNIKSPEKDEFRKNGRVYKANFWSVNTPYAGDCDGENFCDDAFDCCYESPCADYQIPVVITLLRNSNCENHRLTSSDIDEFFVDVNAEYDCLGVPIELVKAEHWDDSQVNYDNNPHDLMDGQASVRIICNDDYNLFYRNDSDDVSPNDPHGDGRDDFPQVSRFNIPRVMNIYIPGNYNGFSDMNYLWEGGVAYYPSNRLTSYCTAFGVDGFRNTNGRCNGVSIATHEIGHWLGLYHTHGKTNTGTTDECPDGSNCCFAGDNICDTEADPNLSPSNCASNNGNGTWDAGSCDSPCNFAFGSDISIGQNIMSYARGAVSLRSFTNCQIAKMIDGLFCARNDLVSCDPDFEDTDFAAPYVKEDTLEICVGDELPGFEIIDFGGGGIPGLNPNCIAWHGSPENTTDFEILGLGTSFTPDVPADIPGTYHFYFDDDANHYSTSSCPNQKRKGVTLIVHAPLEAGVSDSILLCANADQDYALFYYLGINAAAGGQWTGPSDLQNEHLGAFNPEIHTPGTYQYIVQSSTACGAVSDTASISVSLEAPTADFGVDQNWEIVNTNNLSLQSDEYLWAMGDEVEYQLAEVRHEYEQSGSYTICLISSLSRCESHDTLCSGIEITTSLPDTLITNVIDPTCYGFADGSIELFPVGADTLLQALWSTGDTTNNLSMLTAGVYDVRLSTSTGKSIMYDFTLTEPDSLLVNTTTTPSSGNDGRVEMDIQGGTAPYELIWEDSGIDPDSLAPGFYAVTVGDANGCTKKIEFEISFISSAEDQLEASGRINLFPNPASDQLQLEATVPMRSLKIYDYSGQKVWEKRFDSPLKEFQVLLSDFSPGAYILQYELMPATGGKDQKNYKSFVIER